MVVHLGHESHCLHVARFCVTHCHVEFICDILFVFLLSRLRLLLHKPGALGGRGAPVPTKSFTPLRNLDVATLQPQNTMWQPHSASACTVEAGGA